MQVNYRGSTGYGDFFSNAGNQQWGTGSMQHDLTDSVRWAIEKGIADPKKVSRLCTVWPPNMVVAPCSWRGLLGLGVWPKQQNANQGNRFHCRTWCCRHTWCWLWYQRIAPEKFPELCRCLHN